MRLMETLVAREDRTLHSFSRCMIVGLTSKL
jgi:hypothetical protein